MGAVVVLGKPCLLQLKRFYRKGRGRRSGAKLLGTLKPVLSGNWITCICRVQGLGAEAGSVTPQLTVPGT